MGKALGTFERCFFSKLKVANGEILARKIREANEEKSVLTREQRNHHSMVLISPVIFVAVVVLNNNTYILLMDMHTINT